jgi:hypothetical protein
MIRGQNKDIPGGNEGRSVCPVFFLPASYLKLPKILTVIHEDR